MSFTNPLMLLGLAGALVPILIHLIHRRKPRQQLFAAIEFVLRSVERVENRWRLRRFLLLASRVLLISAVALAAAKPLFGDQALERLSRGGPERLAIVIDVSLSMRQTHGDRSAFARALTAARNLVDELGPEDQAVLIFAGPRPVSFPEAPTSDRNRLLAELDRAEPSFHPVDLAPAVSLAAALLSAGGESAEAPPAAEGPTRRVVVLSDMAGHGFRAAADLGPDPESLRLEIADVLDGVPEEERSNRVITELSAVGIPSTTPGTMELRSRVRAFPGSDRAPRSAVGVGISLHAATGELTRGSLELSAGAVVDKSLVHAFEEVGHLPVRTQLEPDVLVEDDLRYAIADVRRPVRALIVDGAPSGVPKEGEVFYLERALLAGARDQPAPRIITVDELHRTELAGFEVLMLVGVPSLPSTDAERVVSFVEAGGGLLVAVTRDLDVEAYNRDLGRVLPRRLRGLKEAAPAAAGSSGPVALAAPVTTHPILDVFDAEALDGLTSARTHGYFLLEPGRPAGSSVLLSFEDGQPALVESAHLRGRTLLWTTTLDRDLSDFVIRPAFVPLIRRALLHLGGALSSGDPRSAVLGERYTLELPRGTRGAEIVAPDGTTRAFELSPEEDPPQLSYGEAPLPGHYRVRVGSRGSFEEKPELAFAVNVDPRESDLRIIRPEEALTVLRGGAPGDAPSSVSAIAQLGADPFSRPEAVAMLLLLLALFAFLGESALTAERRVSR